MLLNNKLFTKNLENDQRPVSKEYLEKIIWIFENSDLSQLNFDMYKTAFLRLIKNYKSQINSGIEISLINKAIELVDQVPSLQKDDLEYIHEIRKSNLIDHHQITISEILNTFYINKVPQLFFRYLDQLDFELVSNSDSDLNKVLPNQVSRLTLIKNRLIKRIQSLSFLFLIYKLSKKYKNCKDYRDKDVNCEILYLLFKEYSNYFRDRNNIYNYGNIFFKLLTQLFNTSILQSCEIDEILILGEIVNRILKNKYDYIIEDIRHHVLLYRNVMKRNVSNVSFKKYPFPTFKLEIGLTKIQKPPKKIYKVNKTKDKTKTQSQDPIIKDNNAHNSLNRQFLIMLCMSMTIGTSLFFLFVFSNNLIFFIMGMILISVILSFIIKKKKKKKKKKENTR
ncbi:MAG: hypothetical protein ACTSPY_04610 [Candidatus Helarchaeota archaeon]